MKFSKKVGYNLLATTMVVSCLIFIWSIFKWDGGMILVMAIFSFGILLGFYLLPLSSIFMLKTSNKWLLILFYLPSLTSLITLGEVNSELPLKTHISENGDGILTPPWIAETILISGAIFVVSATLVFLFRLYQINHREQTTLSHPDDSSTN